MTSAPVPGWDTIQAAYAEFALSQAGKRYCLHLQPLWKQDEFEHLQNLVRETQVFLQSAKFAWVFQADLEPLLPRLQHLNGRWTREEIQILVSALEQGRLLKEALQPLQNTFPQLARRLAGVTGNSDLEHALTELCQEKKTVFEEVLMRGLLKGRQPLFTQLHLGLLHYDTLQARIRYAQSIKGQWPQLSKSALKITGLLPLLHPQSSSPWSIEWPEHKLLALLSGRHGSGKSYFIQNLALAIYAHQAGLALPCQSAQLPFFKQVRGIFQTTAFVEQLALIRPWLSQDLQASFIFLDQFAWDTNPGEAYALTLALLNHLVAAGARVICTTHQSLLQQATAKISQGFNLALVAQENKKQRSYTLQLHQSERSQTLETAAQLGWPQKLLQNAQGHYQALAPKSKPSPPAPRPKPPAPKPAKISRPPLNLEAFQVGQWVYVEPLGLYGELKSKPLPPKYEAEVHCQGIRLSVSAKDLVISSKRKEKKNQTTGIRLELSSSPASDRCDLHEYRVFEAIPVLEKFLDTAYTQGLNPVYIIHGKGEGKLKKAVHEYLKTAYYVRYFRLGHVGEGDSGVTVVELV